MDDAHGKGPRTCSFGRMLCIIKHIWAIVVVLMTGKHNKNQNRKKNNARERKA